MTEHQRPYHQDSVFGVLEMMLYWASARVDRDHLDQWPVELSEVAHYWLSVSSDESLYFFAKGCREALEGRGPERLMEIGQNYGETATRALAALVHSLGSMRSIEDGLERLTQMRSQGQAQPLKVKLSKTQRTLGRAVVDRALGLKGLVDFKRAQADHERGFLALPLIGASLNSLERVSFGALVIDALAELHDHRLDLDEGFAPERLIFSHRFHLIAPRSRPTQLKPLLGPEVQRGEKRDSASDVWCVARLSLSLFTGKPLATPVERLLGELPPDVAAPLKRSLLLQREARFFSGRELRVVLATPLEKWLGQLRYEARQSGSLDEQSSQEADQELGAELILPYEDFAEQRDRESEERVKRRRAEELRLRKKRRNKMRLGQLLGLIVFSLLTFGVYSTYLWYAGELESEKRAALAEALARRERFAKRDLDRQEQLPQSLRDLDFRWRWIPTSAQGALISVSEVTKAQYQVCVDAEKCAPIKSTESCELDMTTSMNLPMTCVTYYEADDFASFVGGRLPHLDEWRYASNIKTYHQFPWGEKPPRDERANLFMSAMGQTQVCSPLVSSLLATLPMRSVTSAGNVHEWVKGKGKLISADPVRLESSVVVGSLRQVKSLCVLEGCLRPDEEKISVFGSSSRSAVRAKRGSLLLELATLPVTTMRACDDYRSM